MSFLFLAASDTFVTVKPALIFWTLVTFIVLLIVLRWKAWGPILELASEREKQIENAIESAKRERAEAERLLAEQKTAITEARREAAEMLQKNKADMDKFRTELMAQAKKQAEDELQNARRLISEERAKALADVKGMAVDLAIEIAHKLIGERLDDSKHRHLAEQFIDQLGRGEAPRQVV